MARTLTDHRDNFYLSERKKLTSPVLHYHVHKLDPCWELLVRWTGPLLSEDEPPLWLQTLRYDWYCSGWVTWGFFFFVLRWRCLVLKLGSYPCDCLLTQHGSPQLAMLTGNVPCVAADVSTSRCCTENCSGLSLVYFATRIYWQFWTVHCYSWYSDKNATFWKLDPSLSSGPYPYE